ncbi:ATP12-domain-containing protein [Serendipita vermifera]|nr:ATP12-domain-containing protein [Serendipita vermifera]
MRIALKNNGKAITRINLRPRGYATAAQDGPPVTQTNRAQTSMKRFWDTARTETGDGYIDVTLDGRTLKTPGGNKIRLPPQKKLLATLIANEWDVQDTIIKPHALPLTSIASRAIDGLATAGERLAVAKDLMRYFDTDTLCYHESEPEQLVKQQKAHWDPLIQWWKEDMGLEVKLFDSVLIGKQTEEAKSKLLSIISDFDSWQMAAYERAVYTTKSAIVALAIVKRRLDVEQAARAAHVEVNSQIERWGEVEDSHDVDYQDIRRQLGSVASVLVDF